jgi:hypothetical protein
MCAHNFAFFFFLGNLGFFFSLAHVSVSVLMHGVLWDVTCQRVTTHRPQHTAARARTLTYTHANANTLCMSTRAYHRTNKEQTRMHTRSKIHRSQTAKSIKIKPTMLASIDNDHVS